MELLITAAAREPVEGADSSVEMIVDAVIGTVIMRVIRRDPYQPAQASRLVDTVPEAQRKTPA